MVQVPVERAELTTRVASLRPGASSSGRKTVMAANTDYVNPM